MSNSTKFNTYFAAANGYSGFRSYFNTVFSPDEYTRIYVLKGGPGTGKSSLMKKVGTHFKNLGFGTESILCSSDPSSFDGVIIHKQSKKFAIIDGTAPHEVDAKIPGALDEIINLGEAWDRDKLTREREQIIKINKSKKTHYKNAYEFLKLAGEFAPKTKSFSEAYLVDCQKSISSILSDLPGKKRGRKPKIKLISSFGKTGYRTLDTSFLEAERQISVIGCHGSESVFMECLRSASQSSGIEYTLFPSPLSHDVIEAIYFEDADMLISTRISSENKIDTSLFSYSPCKNENTEYYEKLHGELTSQAKEEFAQASSAHFELEAIYTPAMDFEKVDKIRNEIVRDIEAQL